MNRRKNIVFTFALIVSVAFILDGSVGAELYTRAPDTLPGTIPEMRTPEYWIAQMDDPDEVMMSVAEIEELNNAYLERIHSEEPFADISEERDPDLSYWWPGHVLVGPDFSNMDGAAVSDTVKSRIKIQINDALRNKPYGNYLAIEYAGHELDAFEAEMNLAAVPSSVTPRRALAVRTTHLRNVPSFFPMEPGILNNETTRWDIWNVGLADINSPVWVLHTSASGAYLLVYCEGEGYGWSPAEDIAFDNDGLIDSFAAPEYFVICTDNRTQIYADEECTIGTRLARMGDRFPSTEENIIMIPTRNVDGSLGQADAYIRENDKWHVGWVPYTRRNIITTALNLLDEPYDWSNAYYGRQHETTYRDIFSVFGFDLPWHGALFTIYGGNEEVMMPEIGVEAQHAMMLEHEPFTTIMSVGGHALLLLGEYEGKAIVFDNNGYSYEGEDGNTLWVRRVNINDSRMPSYFLKRKVTFCTLNN